MYRTIWAVNNLKKKKATNINFFFLSFNHKNERRIKISQFTFEHKEHDAVSGFDVFEKYVYHVILNDCVLDLGYKIEQFFLYVLKNCQFERLYSIKEGLHDVSIL